jgi:hypothetical protein
MVENAAYARVEIASEPTSTANALTAMRNEMTSSAKV